jgi:metal-responsive CopG/Arc/MetJ family transcriptional regulator
MKVKLSISVSDKLVEKIDKMPGAPARSTIVEQALILFFKSRSKQEQEARDLVILNAMADELNEEAEDVLKFQAAEPEN